MGNRIESPQETITDNAAVSKITRRRRTKGPSEKLRSLAAQSLAPRLGYLSLRDLAGPDNVDLQAILNVQPTTQHFSPGSVIRSGSSTEQSLFIIRSGAVNVVRLSSAGVRFSIKRLEPGTVFGELPLYGQSMLGAQAEAAEHCELLKLTEGQAEQVLMASPSIAVRLLTVVGSKLVEAGVENEQAAFQPVTARVASLLLKSANEQDQVVGFTHQEIADMLGVYRETVTNALAELKQDRLIDIGRKRILVRDREALDRLASF